MVPYNPVAKNLKMLDKVPSSRVVNFRDYVTVPKQNEYENVTLVCRYWTDWSHTDDTKGSLQFRRIECSNCSVNLQFMNC